MKSHQLRLVAPVPIKENLLGPAVLDFHDHWQVTRIHYSAPSEQMTVNIMSERFALKKWLFGNRWSSLLQDLRALRVLYTNHDSRDEALTLSTGEY